MSFVTKNVSGSAKNTSMSQIWINCGIRNPIRSKASTPRQMNRSTPMAGKDKCAPSPMRSNIVTESRMSVWPAV